MFIRITFLLPDHAQVHMKFSAGNFVHLSHPKLGKSWHPFSIGSECEGQTLDFYIEVFGEGSWTDKLWDLVNKI